MNDYPEHRDNEYAGTEHDSQVRGLRYAHTCRSLEQVDKPWGVEWRLYGAHEKTRREGPYRTEAEAKMRLNAIKLENGERSV